MLPNIDHKNVWYLSKVQNEFHSEVLALLLPIKTPKWVEQPQSVIKIVYTKMQRGWFKIRPDLAYERSVYVRPKSAKLLVCPKMNVQMTTRFETQIAYHPFDVNCTLLLQ